MLCQNCGKREATIHIKTSVNEQSMELHLCEKCAENIGSFAMGGNVQITPQVIRLFAPGDPGQAPGQQPQMPQLFAQAVFEGTVLTDEEKNRVCPGCGLRLEDVIKNGTVGCGKCYEAFGDNLTDVLMRLSGIEDERNISPMGTEANETVIEEQIPEPVIEAEPEPVPAPVEEPAVSENTVEEPAVAEATLEELEEQLRKAAAEERYEDAIVLRDRINALIAAQGGTM